MNDWVSRSELDDAIDRVTADIRDTENKLRTEFTSTVRFEVGRIDSHLDAQDERLTWIYRFALGALVTIIAGLIYLIH